jgi:hypothetical protein
MDTSECCIHETEASERPPQASELLLARELQPVHVLLPHAVALLHQPRPIGHAALPAQGTTNRRG